MYSGFHHLIDVIMWIFLWKMRCFFNIIITEGGIDSSLIFFLNIEVQLVKAIIFVFLKVQEPIILQIH